MDETVVSDIRATLETLVRAEQIAVPLAIESGSRAWGFPSPDSDYDCRFVYVRRRSDTLTLFPKRDVIEHPLTDLIDLNGWDLAKAVKLMLRGNAVIVEWLNSPYAYCEVPGFRDEFLSLAGRICDRQLIGKHYYYLARDQIHRALKSPDQVPLKKTFYALRPLLALRWLEAHPDAPYPPMNFHDLCAGVELPVDVRTPLDRLLDAKKRTRELGTGRLDPVLYDFLVTSFERAEPWRLSKPVPPDKKQEADAFWRTWLDRLAPPE